MLRAINIAASLVAGLMYGGIHFLLLSVHAVTCYLAWKAYGVWSAILVFATPPFSELFLAYSEWDETGVFWNTYTFMIALVLMAYAIQVCLAVVLVATDTSQKQ